LQGPNLGRHTSIHAICKHNPAPSLPQNDIGVALGTATEVAMETDVITVVKGDLRAWHMSLMTTRNSAEFVVRLRR
jgi:cation transport ATPase